LMDKKTRRSEIILTADNIRWRQEDWVEVGGDIIAAAVAVRASLSTFAAKGPMGSEGVLRDVDFLNLSSVVPIAPTCKMSLWPKRKQSVSRNR